VLIVVLLVSFFFFGNYSFLVAGAIRWIRRFLLDNNNVLPVFDVILFLDIAASISSSSLDDNMVILS
jgi:hypothetical protein